MGITVRPFDMSNIAASYEFLMDTFRISFGDDNSKWPNNLGSYSLSKFSDHYDEIIKKDPESIYSVWDNDKLIGEIGIKTKWKEKNCGYISLFYLVPEYRNRGVGSILDQYAISAFKEKGLLKARLTVSELNIPGIKFYEKNGWKQLGPDADRPLGIIMEKEI